MSRASDSPPDRPSPEELTAPFRRSVAENSTTDEELSQLVEEARRDVWKERQAPAPADGRLLSPKEGVLEMIGRMRDDVTTAEILDAVAVRLKIEEGLRQLDAGQGIPHDEVMARLAKWAG